MSQPPPFEKGNPIVRITPKIVTLTTLIQVKDTSAAFSRAFFSSTEVVIGSCLSGAELERIKKLGSQNAGESIQYLIGQGYKLIFQTTVGWTSLSADGCMMYTFQKS